MSFRLHYAPDNASLIIRLALETGGMAYETVLVDRAARGQQSPAYLRLNPNGLIPVLETPEGAIFETGAILLWLADRHPGLAPGPADPARGDMLKWLFYLSNTLHPALRMLFYPEKYIDGDIAALRTRTKSNLADMLDKLDALLAGKPDWIGATTPTILDPYLACCLRWMALYPPGETGWFELSRWPALERFARLRDDDPATLRAAQAEGLGPTPFSTPHHANPPEGSAT
ncbi:glutathione S-transferase family protein [Primorskyibacter aestuariivivens]|uniref:glutathione S-transferase family protein n=1 Tax=Primorskyibacter aestuariivivens TaxID=1888912 RepID=UPI0023005F25|nr:glutathione S-transferase family protein [Primorskyibacter aestuariivivens]MDA7427081.1 glutathione S-transferase family protein [Primorskyibacter aestuariivivens]